MSAVSILLFVEDSEEPTRVDILALLDFMEDPDLGQFGADEDEDGAS